MQLIKMLVDNIHQDVCSAVDIAVQKGGVRANACARTFAVFFAGHCSIDNNNSRLSWSRHRNDNLINPKNKLVYGHGLVIYI